MKSNLSLNPHCLLAGTDHLTCRSRLQSAPNALSRFKNEIFQHRGVREKISNLLKLTNLTFAEIFTSPAKI